MKNQGILVEICPSSNKLILEIEKDNHPFHLYKENGVPLSIKTDNEGINRTNLTNEFAIAVRDFNLTYSDLKELVRNSIEYSFLEGESLFIDRNYNKQLKGFSKIYNKNWIPNKEQKNRLDTNPKLKHQVKLEQSFMNFENQILKKINSE